MNILRTTLYLLAIIMLVPACDTGGGDGNAKPKTNMVDELAARNLAAKAANLELNGRELESVELYKELAKKYSHTETYAKLEDEMFHKGISIENPNLSKTSQSMFKTQNMVVSFNERKGFYPNISAIKTPPDAWGSPLVLRISEDETDTYEFIIISKGPDATIDTNDDLFLLYEGKRGRPLTTRKIVNAVPDRPKVVKRGKVDMANLKGGSLSASGGRAGSASGKASEASPKTSQGSKDGVEKPNKRTGQKEVVISLEDL